MIRAYLPGDRQAVAQLWLQTNLQAHDFIPADYWRDRQQAVSEQLGQAQVFVLQERPAGEILGFIGLQGDYVAGLFVSPSAQGQGLGRQLLRHAMTLHRALALHVYQKNQRAVRFYQKQGFCVQCAGVDPDTGEKEFHMTWQAT